MLLNATWFFTVNLATRQNNHLLVEQINALRLAFRYIKDRRPFIINAVVIMPDHLHCIWTLPAGDTDFSTRWNLLKGHFSRPIDKGERISQSRISKRERGIWQRRFWAHLITDQDDFNNIFIGIPLNTVMSAKYQSGLIRVFTVMYSRAFIQAIGDMQVNLIFSRENK